MERALLRYGNVYSSDDWKSVLEPVVVCYRHEELVCYFRGDAAFADPDIYRFLEADNYFFAIRLKGNNILYGHIEHLLTRPVDRPPHKPIVKYHSVRYQAAIQDQFDGIAFLRLQQVDQLLGFELQQDGIVIAADIEKVVETAAVGLATIVEMAIQDRDIPPPPGHHHEQGQHLEVLEMVPMELIFKRSKKKFRFFGQTDDFKHNGNLQSISCSVKPLMVEIAFFY